MTIERRRRANNDRRAAMRSSRLTFGLRAARLSRQLNRFLRGEINLDHIVPRWEWRTFGEEFGGAERRFTALAREKVQTSTEVYLLVRGSDANVKYRDNVLDIKQLERVNEDGLEQWRPLLKAPFPLADDATARLSAALGLPAASLKSAAVSFDELLASLESTTPGIRGVLVSEDTRPLSGARLRRRALRYRR